MSANLRSSRSYKMYDYLLEEFVAEGSLHGLVWFDRQVKAIGGFRTPTQTKTSAEWKLQHWIDQPVRIGLSDFARDHKSRGASVLAFHSSCHCNVPDHQNHTHKYSGRFPLNA